MLLSHDMIQPQNLQKVEYDAAVRAPKDEANIDMLAAILKTGNKSSLLKALQSWKMDHLTTAPVEFRSLAICGIEGVKVSTIESNTHT